MNNLLTEIKRSAKEDYNSTPVHYCKDCLSLKIMRVPGMKEACYCDDCGCTDIAETNIEEWQDLYKEKHGFSFLNNSY